MLAPHPPRIRPPALRQAEHEAERQPRSRSDRMMFSERFQLLVCPGVVRSDLGALALARKSGVLRSEYPLSDSEIEQPTQPLQKVIRCDRCAHAVHERYDVLRPYVSDHAGAVLASETLKYPARVALCALGQGAEIGPGIVVYDERRK